MFVVHSVLVYKDSQTSQWSAVFVVHSVLVYKDSQTNQWSAVFVVHSVLVYKDSQTNQWSAVFAQKRRAAVMPLQKLSTRKTLLYRLQRW